LTRRSGMIAAPADDGPYGLGNRLHSDASYRRRTLASDHTRRLFVLFRAGRRPTQSPTFGRGIARFGVAPHVSVAELEFGPTQICSGETDVTHPMYRGPSPSPALHATRTLAATTATSMTRTLRISNERATSVSQRVCPSAGVSGRSAECGSMSSMDASRRWCFDGRHYCVTLVSTPVSMDLELDEVGGTTASPILIASFDDHGEAMTFSLVYGPSVAAPSCRAVRRRGGRSGHTHQAGELTLTPTRSSTAPTPTRASRAPSHNEPAIGSRPT
jgi:hypothetical protein